MFSRFDNHAPTVEVDRQAAHCLTHRELRTILHLDRRTVSEPQHRVCVLCRANHIAATNLFSYTQGPRFGVSHHIKWTIGSLHSRFQRSKRHVTLNQRQGDQAEPNQQCRRDTPTQNDGPQTVRLLLLFAPGWYSRRDARFPRLLQGLAAGNALVGVIDEQQRARLRKAAAQVRRNQRLKIRAPFDAIADSCNV